MSAAVAIPTMTENPVTFTNLQRKKKQRECLHYVVGGENYT